jgi:hypothetical protein
MAPPHDQPHDQLDAFRTGLVDVFLPRHRGEPERAGLDGIQEGPVKCLVDETRPPPGQLNILVILR